jgi:hypothetical protein
MLQMHAMLIKYTIQANNEQQQPLKLCQHNRPEQYCKETYVFAKARSNMMCATQTLATTQAKSQPRGEVIETQYVEIPCHQDTS